MDEHTKAKQTDDMETEDSATSRAMTTAQAASLINVSKQYIIKLIDEGILPAHDAGPHQYVTLQDALAYKQEHQLKLRRGLSTIAQLSQAFEEDD